MSTTGIRFRTPPVSLRPFVPALRAVMQSRVRAYAARVDQRVQRNLSGDVLQRRTGELSRRTRVTVEVAGFVMRVIGRSDTKHSAAQELGATIPPHLVRPVRARALAFVLKTGEGIVTQLARIPQITLRPRPFLGPAFREEVPPLARELKDGTDQLVASLRGRR